MAGIELSEFIESLRSEIQDAMLQGDGAELRFVADKIDLELRVAAERKMKGGGGMSFKVFGVGAEGSGGAEAADVVTQVVKMSLSLVGPDGEPRLISSQKTRKSV